MTLPSTGRASKLRNPVMRSGRRPVRIARTQGAVKVGSPALEALE